MRSTPWILTASTWMVIATLASPFVCGGSTPQHKTPKVIVSTDIGGDDPDDYQSLVHFLLYADRFDIVGLISSPPSTGRKEHIEEVLVAYEKDYLHLKKHSAQFPPPASLFRVAKQGAIDVQHDTLPRELSEGAQWIIDRARENDTEPIYVLVWGSITDVAQAVHYAPDIKKNIRVYSIGSWNTRQDPKARDYLYKHHQDLWWIENDTTFRGMYMGGRHEGDYHNRTFVEKHVKGHGALGNLFWEKKKDIKMGDTPSVLYLLQGNPEDPEGESWGGSFVKTGHGNNYWTDNPADSLSEGDRPGAKTVNRFRKDYLDDWARRMDWGLPVFPQQLSPTKPFRASVVKIDITPSESQNLLGYGPRMSTGIHDPIFHKIVALDDGTQQFYLISTDICLTSPAEYDRVAARIRKAYGIDPLQVWWTVTHTHSAPEVGSPGMYVTYLADRQVELDPTYTRMMEEKLIEGIGQARDNLAPAKLGVGWGYSQANINRRAIDIDGKASLGLNPDGPVDRRIGMIRIDKEDGTPLALIANYAIHGTVLGPQNTLVSGDAPGVAAEYVEEKLGAPVLFINGAAGNLAPIYSVYPTPRAGHLSQFKVLLGDRILEANEKIITDRKEIKLVTGMQTLETPRKADLGWPEELKMYSRSRKGQLYVRMPVRFLQINNDLAIWSAPIELFCEVSNEVRERSPFEYTFYFGYTNGWFGYLPTRDEWPYGGYEVERVSPFTPAAADALAELVLGYFKGKSTNTSPAGKNRK